MSWQHQRAAPVPGQRLCALADIPDGGCSEFRQDPHDEAFSMLLYRRGSQVTAYVNCCPHFSLPLNARPGEFLLLSAERVMCAYHCAVFRLRDGYCIDGPAEGMSLQAVPVEVRGEQIFMGEA